MRIADRNIVRNSWIGWSRRSIHSAKIASADSWIILFGFSTANKRRIENACETLTRIQDRDGSWRESADATENERIFSTGMIAGYLAKTPFVRKSTLDSAAEHLASHWEADRLTGSIWRVTAAYLHCFSLVRHDQADAILQWCGRELERGFHSDVYDVVQTARVFTLCKAHALPGSQLTRAELVERLIKEQNGDGSYLPRDDSSQQARVAHTLEALVALVRLT